jgi:hypothetical protein
MAGVNLCVLVDFSSAEGPNQLLPRQEQRDATVLKTIEGLAATGCGARSAWTSAAPDAGSYARREKDRMERAWRSRAARALTGINFGSFDDHQCNVPCRGKQYRR